MNLVEQIKQEKIKRLTTNKTIPPFAPGDTVIVSMDVVEDIYECVRAYEGVVIAKRNRGLNSSFIVHKVPSGEGVKRTFQLYLPLLTSTKMKCCSDVHHAKLYYLCQHSGRSARIKEKLTFKRKEAAAE